MRMRPHTIMVGNCYTDRQEVVRKVTAIDKGQVTFSRWFIYPMTRMHQRPTTSS
jgi:hypothetical protein